MLAAALFAIFTGTLQAQPFIYLSEIITGSSSNNSGQVIVIDGATHTAIDSIPIAARPGGIAASPDGKFVYVVSRIPNPPTVYVIATASNTVITTIPLGSSTLSFRV